MKKLLNKTVSIRIITCVLLAALALSLALLLRLGLYSTPWYDDYNYSKYTHSFPIAYGEGIYNAFRGVMYQLNETYHCWQGTFSSIVFMALCPIVISETMYWIGSYVLILLLTVSSIVFAKTITKRVFSISEDASWCIAIATAILMIWRLYDPCQGFYWYNAGVHYVGMHSFMMLLLATLICLADHRNVVTDVLKVIASMLLALICSGGNYVTALQGLMLSAVIVVYAAVSHRRKPFVFLPALAVYIVGFWFNVTAQGNVARSSYFTDVTMSPVKAVLLSFVEAAKHLWQFTGFFTPVFMVLIAIVAWKGMRQTSFKFRFPLAAVVLAFCFYATSFTPTLYAMGTSDIDRVLNAAKLTFQIMLIVSELYVIGWVKNRYAGDRNDIGFVWIYAVCLVALLIPFAVSNSERMSYTPYGAYYYVHTGEAAAYYSGYLNMLNEIHSQGDDVRVGRNIFTPAYLCEGQLSEDPSAEPNQFMAQWYGKNSIAIKTGE